MDRKAGYLAAFIAVLAAARLIFYPHPSETRQINQTNRVLGLPAVGMYIFQDGQGEVVVLKQENFDMTRKWKVVSCDSGLDIEPSLADPSKYPLKFNSEIEKVDGEPELVAVGDYCKSRYIGRRQALFVGSK